MKSSWMLVIAALAVFWPECTHRTDQRIADGVYREPAKVETLTVNGRDITLQLTVTKGPRLGVVSGTYRYDVLKNGELRFGASSNDSFFVFTILDYDWIWNGKDILRKNGQTGETVIFSRDSENK